jgi:CHAT domain-containing protein/tetratricopeptide (TPR) repeat protein
VETAVEVDLTGVDDSLKQPIMDALSALAETQRDDLVRRLMEDRPELRSRLQTILDQVYAVRVQAFGADLPGLLVAIESTGNPDHQVALCRKAIALVDRTGRPDMWFSLHWTLGVSLTQSAAGDRADNIEQAIESVSAALEVKATVVPATSWASALSTLGLLYRQRLRGDPSDNLELAIDAYERALQGSEHRSEVENYASTQNNLANAYSDRRRGDRDENLARAVFLHQQVLLVRTREAVPVAWASSQNNLGNAYARFERRERAANRERAIHAFQQALTVRTQERMPVKWAETMINLGNAWRGRIEGDRLQNLGEARASYRNALEVWTAESAPEHHYNTLNLLAVACLEHRDCAHFRLGPPLLRADLLLPLADEELAALVGDYPELAELWQARQAGKDPTVQSEIREMQLTRSLMTLFLIERADDRKRYLAVHQELASTQVDAVIGSTQQMLGSDGSGEWGEALLAMLEEKHLLTRWRSVGLDAALDERIEFEKLEDCAERLTAQLWTLPMGAAELPRFMGEVLAADDAVVARLGSVGSELQRRRYLARVRARTDTILSAVLIQQVYFPEVANVGMELVLRRKALEAEIWISQRDFAHQGRDPSLAAKHIELQSVRRRIAEKILAIAEDEDAVTFRRNVLDLRLQEEDLEAGLAELVPAANLGVRLQGVTRRSVAAALPGGAALIEYVRVAVRRAEGNIAPVLHYLALVMTGEQPNNARVIDLGPAEAIDGQVAALRAALTGKAGLRPGRHLGRKENRIPSFYSDAALALRSTVFDPLLTSLGETRIIYVAPDGDLARLPLGILPAGKGQFLIDDYDFRYLGAGRDLLRLGAVLTGRPAASLVMADPDYDLPGADGQPLRKVFFVEDVLRVPGIAPPEERPLEHPNLRFDALAGARAEGETVARQLGVTPLIGPAALKAALVACQSPRILHLATHGFFLEDYGSMAPLGRDDTAAHRLGLRIVPRHEDPLLRSWLALAGINRWLRHETVPKEAGNCVLTAMDAATLDLADTELVVLSACESGLGVIHVGEGVLGLRRAFALAGAQTVIMSLWQIPDQQTQELIVDFYKRSLQSGESRAAALRAAQLTMKKKYRDPFYWGAFVCEGEPGPFFTAPS